MGRVVVAVALFSFAAAWLGIDPSVLNAAGCNEQATRTYTVENSDTIFPAARTDAPSTLAGSGYTAARPAVSIARALAVTSLLSTTWVKSTIRSARRGNHRVSTIQQSLP